MMLQIKLLQLFSEAPFCQSCSGISTADSFKLFNEACQVLDLLKGDGVSYLPKITLWFSHSVSGGWKLKMTITSVLVIDSGRVLKMI